MAKFPSVLSGGGGVPSSYPFSEAIEFRTLSSTFANGTESRKKKYTYPRRNLTIKYDALIKANIKTIWEFYLARKGMYEAFNFFYPYTSSYDGEYVGTGDGSTTVFNLPSVTSSSYVLYEDGSSLTSGTDYTFGATTGADGADKVTMAVAPSSGAKLTWDFTGYLKVHCRFAEDIFSYELFAYNLYRGGLKLKGLLNE